MSDTRQALYLIADELRGMATIGKHFAGNVYEVERAHRIMALAARVAALADDTSPAAARDTFFAEPWFRATPALGVEAAVFDPDGAILLVRRRDNGRWTMPGGIAEIGQTPAEGVLRELWEEAGLRGQVARLLGLFDARHSGGRSKVHLVRLVFLVDCADRSPTPGSETLDARFFPPDRLPPDLHYGQETVVPRVFHLRQSGQTFFDPAASYDADLPPHQRPAE